MVRKHVRAHQQHTTHHSNVKTLQDMYSHIHINDQDKKRYKPKAFTLK